MVGIKGLGIKQNGHVLDSERYFESMAHYLKHVITFQFLKSCLTY